MNIRVKFLGGAGSVTGSKYLLEIDDYRLLVDCGLFQGLKELRLRNWDSFPVDPKSIDAVVITHAHIDHSGYLPRLFKQGFEGEVHCTDATSDLLGIMLRDAAKLQEEEAAFARKKGYSRHSDPEPLFTISDAERVMPALRTQHFGQSKQIHPQVSLKYYNAGHILGAGSVELTIQGEYQEKKIVFSGDLGPYENPLHFAPEAIAHADILFVESTYGNREVAHVNQLQALHELLNRCEERGGSLIIPAFSVGRTQLMLYYFWELRRAGKMPNWPIYVDSPMAISVTNFYRKYATLHKLKDENPDDGHYIFDSPYIHYLKEQAASTSLNERPHPCVIISASGMVTGGRILHHLFHRLRKPNETVLISGYQAEGSRGRRLVDGEKEIKIFGELVPVRAHIENMEGFSAHGDQADLMRWLGGFQDSPKMTFIVHGEAASAAGFQAKIQQEKGWNVIVPQYMESFQLFEGV